MRSYLLDQILQEFKNEFKDLLNKKIVFVLPSKRSVVYTQNALKTIYKNNSVTGLFPEIITINEFIEKISGLIVLSKPDLLYYLYLSYQKIFQEEAQPYHSFIKWASMLLNDFNDVVISHPNDNNKQEQIFTNLKNIKEIEHWSLNREPLSENQKKYLDLMGKFYEIFVEFNKTLLQNGYAYSGLNYQQALNKIKESNYIKETHTFVFAGFNALTTTEHQIFEYLKTLNKAKFYWDYDKYYTENTQHEAGHFLRENIKHFGNGIQRENSFFDEEKNLFIASATNDVEEALFIKQTLNNLLQQSPTLDNTAIILSRPDNLNLVLTAIPEGVEYNVSMEYPLYLTSAYQFLSQSLKIFVQLSSQGNKQIYHKYFIPLLANPFFKEYVFRIYGILEHHINAIIQQIKKKNKIYISIRNTDILNDIQLEEYKKNSLKNFLLIFENTEILSIITSINNIFQTYLNHNATKDKITINIVQTISEQLTRIEDILKNDKGNVFKEIKDIQTLVQQIVARESVALKGEPLKGLQIIGLLESRLLDFENIVIPFVNEGIFPPDHHKNSFFPYDLRYYYQLPTHQNDDAIFSYLFYRNLHSPKNIYLSYNNSSFKEDAGLRKTAEEPSRFIQQIQYELSQKQNIKINYYNIDFKNKQIETPAAIEIPKTDDVLLKLKHIIFSPTSITTYLDCSLKFYFRYVLSLKPAEETTEELEANIEGNIFHKVMSDIYSNPKYLNNHKLNTKELKKLVTKETSVISGIIKKEIDALNFEHKGKILIKEKTLEDDIIRFIKREINSIEENDYVIEIIHTEKNNQNIQNTTVNLNTYSISGIPDRIDFIHDVKNNEHFLRVVDYKSSIGDSDLLEYADLLNIFDEDKKPSKSINKQLQLLIYIYYSIKNELIKYKDFCKYGITGVILPLKNKIKDHKDFNHYITNSKSKHIINDKNFNELESTLTRIFSEIIFNKQKSFVQTENTYYTCQYCNFNTICKKSE